VSDETEIQVILEMVKFDYDGQINVLYVLLFEEGKYKEDRVHSGDTSELN